MEKTRNSAIDRNIEHLDNEIDMDGLESFEGTKVGNIKPQVGRFVFPDGPGVIVLASCRLLTVVFSLESLSAQLLPFLVETGESQWQPHNNPKRRKEKNQTQAYQPKRHEGCYEFHEYLFKLAVEESGTIFNEGMNNEREKYFYMTVYVRTINGKTTSIRCNRSQNITRIKDEVDRNTKMPKALQHLSNQGKALSERKNIQENNIINEMTLGLQGGMKEDEMREELQ